VFFEDAIGENHDRLLSIERFDPLGVHILNVVNLRKRRADKHRQPNEKQTTQVRDDVHCARIHSLISFLNWQT
jgi:hypothetical protein